MRPAFASPAFALLFRISAPSKAEDIDLAVVLAADVSRSVDEEEFDLQRKG